MSELDDILAWTEKNAEGWLEGHPGGWTTYFPDERRIFTEAALDSVQQGGMIVEIGCFAGLSTSLLLQVARLRSARVLLVDAFVMTPEYSEPTLRKLLAQFSDVQWRLYPTTSYFAYGIATSNEPVYLDRPVDFCHIDAGHNYEDTKLDCSLWLSHVRSGGAAAFHDYDDAERNAGVVRAVDKYTVGWTQLNRTGYWGCVTRRKP